MKRVWIIVLIVFTLMLTGCNETAEITKYDSIVNEKFMVFSIQWGKTWDSVKNASQLTSAKIIKNDRNIFAVEIEEAEFLGIKGKMMLQFSVLETSFPSVGFVRACFSYDDKDEKVLLEQGKKLYGKRKEFFLDKNGIENPLNPPAWYSDENIEESLTLGEKEYFSKILNQNGIEETRTDAIMRGPLVVISVDENTNMVEIDGGNAAKITNLRSALKK